MGKPSSVLIISVLLVAPSALAGPVPAAAPEATPDPHQQAAILLPWGVVGGQVASPGGYVYCAGCSPINPQQLVLPLNAKDLPLISASGVLPPNQIPTEKEINGLKEDDPEKKGWEGAIPVQQMAMHDDGRYSFSYNTADSSRQEERNLDGSVSGSYSYTDQDGKLVKIDYTAGPRGYNAYGDNIPPQPVFQLPQPVRDTPEVQAAREKFLQAYEEELEKHKKESDTAHTTTTVAPSDIQVSSEGPTTEKDQDQDEATTTSPSANDEGDILPLSAQNDENVDDAVVVSGKSESETGQDDENKHQGDEVDDENDSIVISADEPASNPVSALPNPSYQITIPIGVGGNSGLSIQTNPQLGQKSGSEGPAVAVPVNQNLNTNPQTQSNLQPYFYYVSVGGSPHYVTAPSIPGYNVPYPTSLQATLLNALPLAAVHDTQVPNRGDGQNTNTPSYNKPVFLDLLNNNVQVQEPSPVPQNVNNDQMQMQMQMAQQSPSLSNNQLNLNHPLIGQLVPIQFAPLGSHNGGLSFGYIPGLVLNNGGIVSPTMQQQNVGSQVSNVPVQFPGFSFNFPQQQQLLQQQQQQVMPQQQNEAEAPSSSPTVDNQAEIVHASKK